MSQKFPLSEKTELTREHRIASIDLLTLLAWNPIHSLSDEGREGRPKTVVVPENIDALQDLVTKNGHVTAKNTHVYWCKKMLIKHNHGASKAVYII